MEKKSGSEGHKGRVRKRCNDSYRASSNTSFSCRFHPSFFVCRRHDDQKRIEGTMNWDPTIRYTLPSSTTVAELRILRYLAALPVSMFRMMTIDPCNQVSLSPIMSSLLYENEVDA
ncbi:uncharacterized protein LOC125471093 isoform X1 [Pyrus x bretschneideri]|uniref:uncharacterized protein LOC125471093 isoform X1 n=1 Tax=Pyrus x bretschneideri TaxID=225117 RepID=UPI00203037DF|nr:uncharacterized protein LOC125471093 isoform X1 [Pyrus x bretschneideri]